MSDSDPLQQLESWGRQVDRRARRAQRGRRLLRILGAPGRGLRRGLVFLRQRYGLVLALLVVAALVGAFVYSRVGAPHPTAAGDARPYPTQTQPSGVSATTSPTADPAGPYAGTPAAHWAEGEAGITLPRASAVKGFTRTAVGADLTTVERALVAARLDQHMLIDHNPATLLAIFAPDARPYLQKAFQAHDLSLVSLIDADATLDSHPPRVDGRMTFRAGTDKQSRTVLEVDTNYVWAYGFADGQVVVVHDVATWWFYRSGDVADSSRGMWVYNYQSYIINVDCDELASGLLEPSRHADILTTPDTENPDDYWDPEHAMNVPDTCTST